MEMKRNFIVIDDDPINNRICEKVINYVFPEAEVQTFTDPETAIAYIKALYSGTTERQATLFLDINMPTLSGWEFLEVFEGFDAQLKERFKIFMLSSSVDQRDKDQAAKNKNVSGYLEKPLNRESLLSM
jgi:CheY-like chemotaxis protein